MGSASSSRAEPNVAPLIDVVLVLLIIMMVVTPMLQKAHQVELAAESRGGQPPPGSTSLVLRLDAGGQLLLQGVPTSESGLAAALAVELSRRTDRVMFLDASGVHSYARVMELVDVAARAGVARVGIVPSRESPELPPPGIAAPGAS